MTTNKLHTFLCLPNAPLCRLREGKNWVCLGICKVCGITEWRNSYWTQVWLHATHKPIIQEASVNRKERCFDQKGWQLQGGGGLMSWDHLQRFCPAMTVFGFFGFFFSIFIWPCLILVVAHKIFHLRYVVCDLVSWSGIEPRPHALRMWSPSHWTTGEVPSSFFFLSVLKKKKKLFLWLHQVLVAVSGLSRCGMGSVVAPQHVGS